MKKINPEKISSKIISFLKKTFAKELFTKAVIGLSGGIDSSVNCSLTVKALGENNVYPLILPYGNLNKQAEKDALKITEFLKIPKDNIIKINIKKLVDDFVFYDPNLSIVRKGNIMARVRMILIFDQAKKRNALVVGTENKSEHLLGYFTRFGDESSDIEPARSLYKTQLYDLAKYLGLPAFILNKKPTAGFWQDQTDEGEFGFSYKEADEILYRHFDLMIPFDKLLAEGFDKKVAEKVKARVEMNDFKHRLPYLL